VLSVNARRYNSWVIREATSVSEGSVLESDVCIVGGGAAGISIARELAGGSGTVCLLESGGTYAERETQALYTGRRPTGFFKKFPQYLETSRMRWLGGSTNHWEGHCRPFDPIDFEVRSWIPNSGWPFDRAHLEPYYRRAAELLEIQPFDFSLDELDRKPLEMDSSLGLRTTIYQLSPPTLFGKRYYPDLERLSNLDVLLHANAVDLRAQESGQRVESIEVATLEGRRFSVRARVVVLAAGGLENARLLLSSDVVHKEGLGNQHDLVGRYFVDHVYSDGIGKVFFLDSTKPLDLYRGEDPGSIIRSRYYGVFSLSPEVQRTYSLPNHQFRLHRQRPKNTSDAFIKALVAATGAIARAAGRPAPTGGGPYHHRIEIGGEQSADRENRARLVREVDALGMRRLKLHYDLTSFDKESMRRSMEVLARQLGKSLGARVNVGLDLDYHWKSSSQGDHHIGTTRMHTDPKQGVVDADCRVHGLSNLYIAGSSVYPTSGRANPTYTLVALALRLSDHLRAEIAS